MATIVVGDDDANVRHLFAETLRAAGHTVFEVCDGMELREAQRHDPDLYILDNLGREGKAEGLELASKLYSIGKRVIVTSMLPGATGVPRFTKGKEDLSMLIMFVDRVLSS